MKKKRHAEHANHERWLVSYADFITLLFAFFVMMYALAVKDVAKLKAAAQSIREAFGGAPAVTAPDPGAETRSSPDACVSCATLEAKSELGQMKSEIDEAASLETGSADLGDQMKTLVDRRGLVVRLSAKDFFAPGETSVRTDLRPLLDRIGRVVSRSRRAVRIEGYSDSSEVKTPGYASDWELSAARAAWVARYWIARFEMDPRRIGVAGYAHYRPLPTEDSAGEPSGDRGEWSRGKNRRVEIVVER